MAKTYPTQRELQEAYYYTNGSLFYREGKRQGRRLGGKSRTNLYGFALYRNKTTFYNKRLIFIYFWGSIPENYVVLNINRDNFDDRIENLILLFHYSRDYRRTEAPTEGSGQQGVTWSKHALKWRASIYKDGLTEFLGYYDDVDRAIAVRKEADRDKLAEGRRR